MALNIGKFCLARRLMSVSVNAKLVSCVQSRVSCKLLIFHSQVETLSKSPIAKKLGDINEILQTTTELNNYPSELWQQTYDFLKQEGFRSEKFAYMISQNPKLLVTSQDKLITSINNWRSFQFGERKTITLLGQFPELLQLQNMKDLSSKIGAIKLFVGGDENVFKVLLNSPASVIQSNASLNEKIAYLKTEMQAVPFEVCKSEALAADIFTIKSRHIFLKRLGLYVVKKKKEPNEISTNPKLCHIIDTSDKRFATKVCHVTLDEFETFQELYRKELDDEVEEDSEDEIDGDDDEVKVAMDWEK